MKNSNRSTGKKFARRALALILSVMFIISLLAQAVSAVEIKLPAHKAVAEQIADEGTVLLKNSGALPLTAGDKVVSMGYETYEYSITTPPSISTTGFYPESMVLGGLGSGKVYTDSCVSYFDGMKGAVADGRIASYETITDGASASGKDKAIYYITRMQSEANDSPEAAFYLTETEKAGITSLINAIGKEKVIVVLNTGSVIDTSWLISQDVGAIVCVYYGGEMAGKSLANVLTGKVSPSGKTVDTWAKAYTDYPCVSVGTARQNTVTRYTEDIYTGYRYFETFDPEYTKVNYEFGFGLSYTNFALTHKNITVSEDGTVSATVTVTNLGVYSGKEVVQVYCKAPSTALDNPAKELVGFAKTKLLAPGESEAVTVCFDLTETADFDDLGAVSENSWILQKGDYSFYIGNSVRNAGEGGVVYTHTLSENTVVKVENTSFDTLLYERLKADGSFEQLNTTRNPVVNAYGSTVIQAEAYTNNGYSKTRGESFYQGALEGMGVGYLGDASAFVEYDLYVERAGDYNIAFAFASFTTATDVLTVYVNGVEQTAVTVDITPTHLESDKLWYKCSYIDNKSNVITLPEGKVTLKIASNGSKMTNMDFFELYNSDISSVGETVIEAENLTSSSLSTPYGHYPDGMATGRSNAAGTTYTFKVNAFSAGRYYLALAASNVSAASVGAAKITVNGVDVTERIALKRSAYGGSDGLSDGKSYPFTTNIVGGGTYINYDANSDDYMFVKTDDVLVDLAAGENTVVITTLDTSITCIDSLTFRPEAIGAANTDTYTDNTADLTGGYSLDGAVLDTLITFEDLLEDESLIDAFLSQFSIDDLIAISHLQASGEGNINSSTGAVGGNSTVYGKVDEKFNIPLSNTADGPAGVRMNNAQSTWFPCMTMLASTYNTELAEEFGNAIATECINGSITMWLAPGLNIHRDPLCGRNFEYFSEDPFVTAEIASAIVRSVQSEGVSVCVKHYFANNQETRRHSYDAYISARAIREIYVKAFEKTVKNSDPWAIMSSYNRVNGSYVACSEDYLKGILRTDWGYEGLIIGDWGSGYSHLNSLNAGNNVKSMYPTVEVLHAAYQSGILTRDTLEENAAYVVNYLMTVEKAKQYVCFIGDEGYTTLQSAIDSVSNGETIVLMQDIELSTSLVIPNKNITFTIDGKRTDGGNYKLTYNGRSTYIIDCLGRANVNFANLDIYSAFTGIRFRPSTNLVDENGNDVSGKITRKYVFSDCNVTFSDLGFNLNTSGASNLAGYELIFDGCTLKQEKAERLFYIVNVSDVDISFIDTDIIQQGRSTTDCKGLFQIDSNAVNTTFNFDSASTVTADPTEIKVDSGIATYPQQYLFMLRGTTNTFNLNVAEGTKLYLGGNEPTAEYSFIYKESDGSTVKVSDGGAQWIVNETAAKAGVKLPTITNTGYLNYGWTWNGNIYGAELTNPSADGDTVISPVFLEQSDFDMEDGAAIRNTDEGGIRFTTVVSEETRELLGENAVFGTLIAPNALLSGELTLETAAANDFANIVTKRWATNDEGKLVYYAALVGFPDTTAAYRTTFAARAYVTVTYADGSTNTIYTDFDEDNVRSAYKVAHILYNRENDPIKDDKYINNIIAKSETCSPCYGTESFKCGDASYTKCKFCTKLMNAPTSVDISSGKYVDSFDFFVSGPDVDVTYTFTNTPGSNAQWHNFIMDVQPAVTFSDGSVYGLYNDAYSKFPVIPYYNAGYYSGTSQTKHDTSFASGYGVAITKHSGTMGLLKADGTDITAAADFKTYMAEGLNVTVHFERTNYGVLNMTVDYVTRTTGCYGHLEVTYGFEGYKDLYLGITGESCKITDLAVQINKGTPCAASSGSSII